MAGSLKSRESNPYSFSTKMSSGSLTKEVPLSRRGELKSDINRIDSFSLSGSAATEESLLNGSAERKWEVKLSFPQVMVLWSIISGTMLMVFLFGLYAGRDQGIQAALEGNRAEAMRLPIANDQSELKSDTSPIAVLANEQSSKAVGDMNSPSQKFAGAGESSVTAPVPGASEKETGSVVPNIPPEKQDIKSVGAVEGAGNTLSKGSSAKEADSKLMPTALGTESGKQNLKETNGEKPDLHQTAKTDKMESAPKTVRAGALGVGWYLQVAAARTAKEASGIAKKLHGAGLSPTVESAEVKGSAYYRIVLGPYPTKEGALAMRHSALASKAAKGEPFLKQVK